MMSLKSIYQTVELNGIPVTLLGVQNNVALFIDIDGNEIEVAVNCELETLGFELDSRMLARCEDRDNQADKVQGVNMIIRIQIKTVDGIKWERITGVGGTHESGIPCLVADIVARDFTNMGYAVDDVKWNFSQGLLCIQ